MMPLHRVPVLGAFGALLLMGSPALAASSCKFKDPRQTVSVQGSVLSVDEANSIVSDFGYDKVVAIMDKRRGCIAHVQASSASGCMKGGMASAKGTTFVIPFTPVILLGADSVECR